MVLRERFQNTAPAARVIWLPVAKGNISYFKVFELRAAEVIEWTLPEALAKYGVEITPDQLAEMSSHLAAHIKEWFGRPKTAWRELTPGNAKSALMDDDQVLEYLATPGRAFETLVAENRFSLLVRRLGEDFGLPAPDEKDSEGWRAQAVASLLCTDAAAKCPNQAPGEAKRIIPAGPQRERALKLLGRWQKQMDLVENFEKLAVQADAQTSLKYWARGMSGTPPPLASPGAESALFERAVEQASALDDFEELAGNPLGADQTVAPRWKMHQGGNPGIFGICHGIAAPGKGATQADGRD